MLLEYIVISLKWAYFVWPYSPELVKYIFLGSVSIRPVKLSVGSSVSCNANSSLSDEPDQNDISYRWHTNYREIFVMWQDISTKFTISNFFYLYNMPLKFHLSRTIITYTCRNNKNSMRTFVIWSVLFCEITYYCRLKFNTYRSVLIPFLLSRTTISLRFP